MSSYETDEIWRMNGTEQAKRIRDGQITPEDALEASLQRIGELNDELNAFCVIDEEGAKNAARQATTAVKNDKELGPLHGVPVGIKDHINVKGMRTTYGSTLHENFVPERDSIVVQRIRDAGGIILGKTNIPEFAYQGITDNSVYGLSRNPWDIGKTPGGSSGGSGAAVASGMVPLALGSDGAGSVRIPSSFCGLYGCIASFGRVPVFPEHRDPAIKGASGWESVERIGPMTRTVEDSALLLDVIAGPHHMDRHSFPDDGINYRKTIEDSSLDNAEIAYSEDWGFAAVNPTVREITRDAVSRFEELGASVEKVDPGFPNPESAITAILAKDTDLKRLRKELHEHGPEMEPLLVDILETDWTAQDITEAIKIRQRVNINIRRFMESYDLLLTPTLAVPPFSVESSGPSEIEGRSVGMFHWLSFTYPVNLTGQPAATIPVDWTDDGLPIGFQIIGKHLADETVLAASTAYEQAYPWQNQYFPMDEIDGVNSPSWVYRGQ